MMELLLVQLHVGSIILQMPVSGDPWVDHREETCNGQREEQTWIRISAEMYPGGGVKELMSRLGHYRFNLYHEQVACISGNFSHSQIHHTQIRVTSRGGFSMRSTDTGDGLPNRRDLPERILFSFWLRVEYRGG